MHPCLIYSTTLLLLYCERLVQLYNCCQLFEISVFDLSQLVHARVHVVLITARKRRTRKASLFYRCKHVLHPACASVFCIAKKIFRDIMVLYCDLYITRFSPVDAAAAFALEFPRLHGGSRVFADSSATER